MILPWWIYLVISLICIGIGALILQNCYLYDFWGVPLVVIGAIALICALVFKPICWSEGVNQKFAVEAVYEELMIGYDEMLEMDNSNYAKRDYIRKAQCFNTGFKKYEMWNNNFWTGDFINDDIYEGCELIDLGAFR